MPTSKPDSTRAVSKALPWSLLVLSFAANCGALVFPFIILRKGVDREAYTLFHSVEMLWSKGLYVLSILVVAFSVLFPFAKLAILFRTLASAEPGPRTGTALHWVERLGKWSMLDVFLVSIILSLASQQFFVAAKPQVGLNLFIVAILLSMSAGETISRMLRSEPPRKGTPPPRRVGGWLLALSGLALLAALAFPFLRIEEWFLKNKEYSIVGVVPALWIQEAYLASILVGLFLVAMPLMAWWFSFLAWRTQAHASKHSARAALAQRWSMLDVFGLALVVFAIESDHLMKTEIYWGALFLGATLALQLLFFLSLERLVARGQRGKPA